MPRSWKPSSAQNLIIQHHLNQQNADSTVAIFATKCFIGISEKLCSCTCCSSFGSCRKCHLLIFAAPGSGLPISSLNSKATSFWAPLQHGAPKRMGAIAEPARPIRRQGLRKGHVRGFRLKAHTAHTPKTMNFAVEIFTRLSRSLVSKPNLLVSFGSIGCVFEPFLLPSTDSALTSQDHTSFLQSRQTCPRKESK